MAGRQRQDLDAESELLEVFIILDVRIYTLPDDRRPLLTKLLAPFAVQLLVTFGLFLFCHTHQLRSSFQ